MPGFYSDNGVVGGLNSPVARPNSGTSPSVGTYNYNATPGTQSGSGVFGNVPGQLAVPDPYASLSSVVPGLAQDNAALGANITSELSGQLSPATLAGLSQAQNAFGVGGNINTSPMSLGTTDTTLENQGIGQWSSLLPEISQTQTVSPELEAEIAQYNALMEAAPDPLTSGVVNTTAGIAGAAAGNIEGMI